jgi:hypothetical protein
MPARRGRCSKTAAVRSGEWWRTLEGDDVISLEPLCELPYEPFSLPSQLDASAMAVVSGQVDAYNYFDGKILSNYLISSGNFFHPVSRRSVSRSECEALDHYMQMHNLGHAGVTHVFDLKADTSDKSRHHLEALQREATDILHSLFSAGATSSSSTARRQYEHLQHLSTLRAPRGGRDGNDEGGWVIVDDDEEMSVAMSRQTEEMMWPALPQPEGSQQRDAAAGGHQTQPAVEISEAVAATQGASSSLEASLDSSQYSRPRPPRADPSAFVLPHTDLLAPNPVDFSCLRAGRDGCKGLLGGEDNRGEKRLLGFWSSSAWEALESEGGGARVALERQMGGVAQDPRFADEVSWVDGQVEGGGSVNGGLQALGFSATRIVALHSHIFEQQFVDAIAGIERGRRAASGWGVYQVPQGERNGGKSYLWNKHTLESCWVLEGASATLASAQSPRIRSALAKGGAVGAGEDGGEAHEACEAWGTVRTVGGSCVVMTWMPLPGGRWAHKRVFACVSACGVFCLSGCASD